MKNEQRIREQSAIERTRLELRKELSRPSNPHSVRESARLDQIAVQARIDTLDWVLAPERDDILVAEVRKPS
jgi:hypothetical protein